MCEQSLRSTFHTLVNVGINRLTCRHLSRSIEQMRQVTGFGRRIRGSSVEAYPTNLGYF
jgi:hypothetical protein